ARRVSAGHRRRRGPAGADTGKDTPRDGERVTGPPALADGPGAAPRRGARRHYRAARGGGAGAGADAGADRGAAGAVGRRDVRARPVLRGDAEQRGRRRTPVPRRQHRLGRGGTPPADAPRPAVLPAPRLPGDPELRAAAGLPARRGGGHRHRGVVPRGRSPRTGRPAPAAPRPTGPRTAAVRDPRTTHLRRPGGRAGPGQPTRGGASRRRSRQSPPWIRSPPRRSRAATGGAATYTHARTAAPSASRTTSRTTRS